MNIRIVSKILLASACPMALSAPAFAQAAEEGSTESEIIVTAQNREQSVNDVPIAIDVVSGAELKSAGFASMNDISKIAPVVQLNQDQGTVKITVRGVGTTSNDEAQDTSVVVNVDGEYINRPNVLGISLFDMERVEVLRGPQGTLYGRNSTGGAINFVTRKPGKEFGVDATASYGNYDAIRLDGGVDMPFGDFGGVRVSGFYDKRDGYVSHPAAAAAGPFPAFAGGTTDDNKSYGGRVSLRLEPAEGLTVNLAAEYADRRYTPQVFAATNLNAAGNGAGTGCAQNGFVRVAPAYAQTLCSPANTNFLSTIDRSNFAAPGYGVGVVGENSYAIRGRIAYEFSEAATLTYTAGYRSYSGDSDSFRTLPIQYRSFTYMDEARTQSHELRLNGKLGGIIYQIGGFYFKETQNRESCFALPIGPNGSCLSYFGRAVSSDSKSAFGQVDVPLGETLTLVGGLRYTDSKRDALYRNAGPFFNPLADRFASIPLASRPPGGPPDSALVAAGTAATDFLFNTGSGRKNIKALPYLQTLNLNPPKEDKVTWLLGLNFKPNDDTLVYLKASTGFKAGGFDSVGAYKPETNLAFEGGLKLGFGDSGQHQLNLSAFRYDYKDLQVSVLLDTTVGGQTFNAGKAKIYGLEMEADFALDDKTRFSASFNYLHARYKELFAQFNVFTVPGTGADVNGVGDLDPNTAGVQQPNFAGNRPGFSPTFIVTAGLEHDFTVGSGMVTASVDTMLKSSYYTDFFNYRDGKQAGLTQSNASLTYHPESKKFSIQAFVKNIENTRALTYGSFVSAGPDDIFNWQFGTPRTYGVRLSVDF